MKNPSEGLAFFFKSLNWLFALSFSFLLSLLNFLHFSILGSKNKSTIEFCENKKDHNKYDYGFFSNWRSVVGKNPLGWILPFYPPDIDEALYFTPKKTIKESFYNEEHDKLIF
jgi:hypothetical protein